MRRLLARHLWSKALGLALAAGLGWGLMMPLAVEAAPVEELPIKFKVVAVNPSATKAQQTNVKFYLPTEVTPRDVLDLGGMELEYDDQKSSYFVHKAAVELAPRETRVFEVSVRDLWMVSESELKALGDYTDLLLGRLEKTQFLATAKPIAESVHQRLGEVAELQADDTLSRKQHIGAYRVNLEMLKGVKEDLARMEKLLTFTGGPPVPEMLQKSPLKSDAPSTKTTWLLIILVMVFMGFLGGLFFLTWHKRAQASQDLTNVSQFTFSDRPGEKPPQDKVA